MIQINHAEIWSASVHPHQIQPEPPACKSLPRAARSPAFLILNCRASRTPVASGLASFSLRASTRAKRWRHLPSKPLISILLEGWNGLVRVIRPGRLGCE